jgi:hypothetical protein
MLTDNDLEKIKLVVEPIVENVVDRKLIPVKKDLRYLKKTVNIIAKNYYEADVKLRRRVSRIEKHLGFPENN